LSRDKFTVVLTGPARADFADLFDWTIEKFGQRQADRYSEIVEAAIEALSSSVLPPGAKKRNDIGLGVHTLHVARRGRNARHVVVYRQEKPDQILVLRILHDSMDIAQHLPSNDDS